MPGTTAEALTRPAPRLERDAVVIRFAGDSGDGVQLTGSQFTQATALAHNELATFPDFPAEIRAPTGTTFGVSAFQIQFGARRVRTAGDQPDVLVALNPAALKVNLGDLARGGTIIVDISTFNERNLRKAGFAGNPLEDGTLGGYSVIPIEIAKLTLEAVKDLGLSQKEALRCKNMWTLGLVYWMYGRDREPTIAWLKAKFAKSTDIADANVRALNAGHAYGETLEVDGTIAGYHVAEAEIAPGLYRNVTGAEALAWGLVAAAQLSGLRMVFGSYPITPASSLLHILSGLKAYNVVTFQAEDEIAAICAAIGASYAGSLGVTSSSGPGMALKGEAMGLAIATELPLVIVNSQRAGPSTGLPTKTEQSDLFQSVLGRNADSPLAVVASCSPADCFETAVEAARIALTYMTPVILLTDGYIANASEPWLIPDVGGFPKIDVRFRTDPDGFHPFLRDPETLARVWAVPGTPGLEHRIGGIERDYNSGNISYDPANHQRMSTVRAEKIAGIAKTIPAQTIAAGPDKGRVLVVGWGSTFGPINQAVSDLVAEGHAVAHAHLRHLNPFPANLGALLAQYDHVLVPEMNMGQLVMLLRATYLVDAQSVSKVNGQPFKVAEISAAIRARLESK